MLLLSAAACLRRIWATDFWWQYATGRLVAEQGWPRVDVLSYTAAGAPWVEMRWLYCWGQYELMRFVGPAALVVGKWLAFCAALALYALPAARRAGAVATSAVLAVAVLASTERLLVRPELCAWVLAGAFVFVLDRRRRRPDRLILLLPLLQVVWANTHPSFALGPLLVGLALVVAAGRSWLRERRLDRRALQPLSIVLAATVLASAVTPYGLRGMLVPLRQFGQLRASVYAEVIGEMHGPFAFGVEHTAVAFYVLLIGLCVLSAAANLRALDPFWLLLCGSQLYLSTMAIRNLPLFALAAVPFVLSNVGRSALPARLSPRARRAARLLLALVVAAGCASYARDLATDRFSVRQNDSKQAGLGIARQRFPVREAEFLARTEGRVFATLLESSYLTSRGVPVFADPRGDVHRDALFRRYLAAQRDPEQWHAVVREYDVRYAMAGLDSALLDLLHADDGWRLVYFGSVAAVYARADVAGPAPIATAAEFDRVLALTREDLPPAVAWSAAGAFQRVSIPKPYLLLAELCLRYGRLDAAQSLIDEAAAASPFVRGIAHRRAAIAELRGDWPALAEQATAALAETPDDPQVLYALGEALFHLGRIDEAERRLRRAAELAPDDVRPRAALAAALAESGRGRQALALLDEALQRFPGNPLLLRARETVESRLRSGDDE